MKIEFENYYMSVNHLSIAFINNIYIYQYLYSICKLNINKFKKQTN